MMNFFANMNKKLDEGWKVTDVACSLCKGTVMINPSMTEYFCVRCNKPIILAEDDEENGSSDDERESRYNKIQSSQQAKSNVQQAPAQKPEQKEIVTEKEIDFKDLQNAVLSRMNKPDPSKKLGEKLLEGWTMLGESCPDCESMPLMKSKKGEFLCVACDKYFKNPAAQEQPKTQNTGSKAPEVQSSQKVNPAAQKTQQEPVQQKPEQKIQPTQTSSQKTGQSAPSSGNQQQAANYSSQSISTSTNLSAAQPKTNAANSTNEELQFDPSFFEMNIENYRVLSGLVNKAALDLTKKLETSPCNGEMIANILKLVDAQTQIDRSEVELLRTVMNNC